MGKDKFVFDNVAEPLIPIIIEKIHKVVNISNISFSDVYHTTASVDGHDKYEKICQELKLKDRMNVIVTNYYEMLAAGNNYRMNIVPEYKIGLRPKQFLCLNKIERYHRVRLVAWLLENNLVDKGLVSFYSSQFDTSWIDRHVAFSKEKHYKDEPKYVVDAVVNNRDKFPLVLNAGLHRDNPIDMTDEDQMLYNDTYYSITPETMFFESKHGFHNLHNFADSHFISEKTYKEITAKHPFLLMGWPKTMAHLRSLGYKTFHPFINEDYDDEMDDIKRFDLITREIERLNKFTDDEWIEFTKNVKPIVDYNYDLIMSKTDYAITKNITKDW